MHAAVLDATLDLIADRGYGFSVDDVADRADVHKTTIYRNWATKPALVAAAIERLAAATIDVSRTSDPVADLAALVVGVARALRTASAAQAIRAVVAAAADDPDLVATARRFLAGRYELAIGVIEDAVDTGALRGNIDALLLWQSVVNPLHMMAILGEPAGDSTARAILDQALRGALP